MNIIDAMNSKKEFKRKENRHWNNAKLKYYSFSRNDAVADDWEIKKEIKKIKLYKYLINDSDLTEHFWSDTFHLFWKNGGLVPNIFPVGENWIKTSLFIEVEVEDAV